MTARFVILHHRVAGGEHWDLMLETGDVLATWQLLADPRRAESWPIPARKIGDHRLDYLTYEGLLSGGRGEVNRIDEGGYEVLAHHGVDGWSLCLHGGYLEGRFRLRREASEVDEHWRLAAQ